MLMCFYEDDDRFAGSVIPRKAVAARRGTSLKTVIRHAVEEEIRKAESKAVRRVKFPLLPSKEPRALNLTNAAI